MWFPRFFAEATLVDHLANRHLTSFSRAKGAFVWGERPGFAFVHLGFLRRFMGRANAHTKETMAPHARI